MKKVFNGYLAIWGTLLVIFNIIAFVSPGWIGIEKYSASFWIGYFVITASFLIQLACAMKAFDTENLQKFFYGVSLIRISYAGLIATFVFGGLCMFLSLLWGWLAGLVCFIVVGITVLSIFKAGTAGEIVGEIDDKIKAETEFIKTYAVKSAELCDYAKTEEIKAATKKIAEAFRYSDPVSSDATKELENKITEEFEELKKEVAENDTEDIIEKATEISNLLAERNRICKAFK